MIRALPPSLLAIIFGVTLAIAFAMDAVVMGAVLAAPDWITTGAGFVTWLGNSGWMAIVLGLMAVSAALVIQTGRSSDARDTAKMVLVFAVITFIAILLSGIAVQLLKHLIGRARPDNFEALGAFSYTPLAFDYSFNSFPSGHSTTIGAVAMIGAWLFPRRWQGFATLAVTVGISRVLVGKHYVSDVVAGLGLGALSAALILILLERRGVIEPRGSRAYVQVGHNMRRTLRNLKALRVRATLPPQDDLYGRLTMAVLIGLVASFVLFLSMPWLDLAVSRLFWSADQGFALDRSTNLHELRGFYGHSFMTMFWIALFMLLFAARGAAKLAIPAQIWGFIVTACVLGPGLLANSLFKEHWGRARPADLEVFGGIAEFTMPFEMADQCARNCSFISGEGSAISMMAILVGVLAWPWLRNRHFSWTAALAIFAAAGMALRIIKGRHFLSDTIFALLIMALVVLLLYRAFDIARHRGALSTSALVTDAGAVWRYATGGVQQPASALGDIRQLAQAIWRVFQTLGHVFAAIFAQAAAMLWPTRSYVPRRPD